MEAWRKELGSTFCLIMCFLSHFLFAETLVGSEGRQISGGMLGHFRLPKGYAIHLFKERRDEFGTTLFFTVKPQGNSNLTQKLSDLLLRRGF